MEVDINHIYFLFKWGSLDLFSVAGHRLRQLSKLVKGNFSIFLHTSISLVVYPIFILMVFGLILPASALLSITQYCSAFLALYWKWVVNSIFSLVRCKMQSTSALENTFQEGRTCKTAKEIILGKKPSSFVQLTLYSTLFFSYDFN